MSSKSVPEECLTRVSSKSVLQGCHEKVLQEFQSGVSVARVSSKSVLPERCAIVSSKGVLQDCHLSVSSQGVPQVGSLENVIKMYCFCSSTYVSAGSWASSCLQTYCTSDMFLDRPVVFLFVFFTVWRCVCQRSEAEPGGRWSLSLPAAGRQTTRNWKTNGWNAVEDAGTSNKNMLYS